MSAKNLSILMMLSVLIAVVELIRRERLTFKYACAWIMVCVGGLFFAYFDRHLVGISTALGFKLPSNFIFFTVSCAFMFLSLILTIFLCRQNERNDRIAQRLGILEHEIEEMKKPKENI